MLGYARIRTISSHSSADSPNIIGEVPGSDPVLRGEYVVYTAHVDHLGICPAVNGDNVCHGAIDNPSGTASLLDVISADIGGADTQNGATVPFQLPSITLHRSRRGL